MRLFTRLKQKKSIGMYIPFFGGCIIVMLLVALIATAIRASDTASVETRNAIASAEYAELESALAAFDTVGYPNADLMGDIMPDLRLHFHAAGLLDSLLVSQYGEEYRLIDSEVFRYINLTMEEIETAASQGNSTDLGVENLGVYMLILRNNLSARFDTTGAVLPIGG